MPDIFTAYPKDALSIGVDRLVNWQEVFTPQELGEYVPSFLEEGMLGGKLVIFPLAKSTSLLFVNDATFLPFAKACGLTHADLATWEGMFKAARVYHEYSGGKAFFKYDDWLHYSALNVAGYGEDLLAGGKIDFDNVHFVRLWKLLAKAAVQGDVCLLGGYSTTALMTGEAVCGIGSSASILYFKDTVTLPDNTTMPLTLKALPVPHFAAAAPLAIQRGMGIAQYKTTAEKARAGGVFLRWLTEEKRNTAFALKAGYLPVKTIACNECLQTSAFSETSLATRSLYEAMKTVSSSHKFVVPSYFDGYAEVEKKFCAEQMRIFTKYKAQWDGTASLDALTDRMFDEFRLAME